jgi:hypothetical protein
VRTSWSGGYVSARVRPSSAYRGTRRVRLVYGGAVGYRSAVSAARTVVIR